MKRIIISIFTGFSILIVIIVLINNLNNSKIIQKASQVQTPPIDTTPNYKNNIIKYSQITLDLAEQGKVKLPDIIPGRDVQQVLEEAGYVSVNGLYRCALEISLASEYNVDVKSTIPTIEIVGTELHSAVDLQLDNTQKPDN